MGAERVIPTCEVRDPRQRTAPGWSNRNGDAIREAVSAAVEEFLEPLAQLAMGMQSRASDLIRLMEQAFIHAVERDAALARRPRPSASAVAARMASLANG